MAWLVDGFNLIHAVDALARRLAEVGPAVATRELAAELGRWSALDPKRNRVLLVLDGGPGNLDPVPGAPGLSVRFRAHADALILEELGRADQSHVLVSRDRELVAAAKKGGYHDACDPLRFWRRLEDDLDALADELEKQRTPRPDEVQAWAALFGSAQPPSSPGARATPPPTGGAARGGSRATPPPSGGAARGGARATPPPSGIGRRGSLASPSSSGRRKRPNEDQGPAEPGKDRPLSPEEVQDWLDWFREPPRA